MKKIIALLMVLIICPWEIKACAEDGNITWILQDGVLTVSGSGEMTFASPPWQSHLDEMRAVVVEEGITSVGVSAFNGSETLEKVTLPESLGKICENAFYECKSLKEITLPKNLKEIGANAFDWCGALTEIELPEGIETIGSGAFRRTGIERIRIPKALKADAAAFRRMYHLSSFEVDEENEIFAEVDGILYNKDKTELLCYPCGRKDEVFAVWEGTERIGEYVFNMSHPFKSIILPEGLREIGKEAFYSDNLLETIYLPKSLEKIGDGAFSGGARKYDDFLELEDIYYAGSRADWENIDIGKGQENGAGYYSEPVNVLETVTIHYGELSVSINGEYLETEVYPIVRNERTLVPMRAIFEAMGATVTWDDEEKCAIGERDGVTVKIKIGENALYKNGEKTEIDSPAEIVDDRTMVPVMAIAEAFGAKVDWDNETRCVIIAEY